MYDVVIIGAGIIGGMIARNLSKYQLSVCIAEKGNDVAMGATRANSAIVHAGFDAPEGSLKARLNVQGSKLMEETARQLGVKYIRNGSLVLGFNSTDLNTIEGLYKRGKENGVVGLQILSKEKLLAIEPNVSPNAACALHAPSGAIVCPYELAISAVGNAMDNGAVLKRNFNVTEIIYSNGQYMVKSPTESICAKYVINAAGLYADKIAGMIGDNSFSIHPRKGEYLLLDKECGNLISHTIFRTPSKMGKGILLSPTVDGNLILGPTSVDMKDKEDTSTTIDGITKIISESKINVGNIPLTKVITSFSGLRAVGNTGDFIISGNKPNFINVAGIESPGLSASPAIALYVTEMLKDLGLNMEEKPDYNPNRKPMHSFKELSVSEKNKIIASNSKYGKIVCRCETVSEGEIIEAIHTNPKALDLDSIKRRTRSGMGRCQGGFCSPSIVEILSRELKIPFEDVTKSGLGSEINLFRTKG